MSSEPKIPPDFLRDLTDAEAEAINRAVDAAIPSLPSSAIAKLEAELSRARDGRSFTRDATRAVVRWALAYVPGLSLRGPA